MASGTVASILGTSPILVPGCGSGSARLNSDCVSDSEVVHVDYATHATGFAIHLRYGHDGRHGGQSERRTGRCSRRSAGAQEFGCVVYWRSEESDLTRPPHRAV